MYVKVTLVEGHEARDMQDAVRSEVVELNPVQPEELYQEGMDRGRYTPLEVNAEQDALIDSRGGDYLDARNPPWTAGLRWDEAHGGHVIELPTYQLGARPRHAFRTQHGGGDQVSHEAHSP